MFHTSILFSSPRLCFSDAQKVAILNWAKALHAPEVPSLYAIKKSQNRILNLTGDPTSKEISPTGNIFYFNNIANSIAKVHLSHYP